METEAATAVGRSMREEADRLLSDHRDRILEMESVLKVPPCVLTHQRDVPAQLPHSVA